MAKKNVFIVEEKKHPIQGLVNQTYKFGEDRMTHHKFIKFGEKKVLQKGLKINIFYRKFFFLIFFLYYTFAMGHAIQHRLIDLVKKTLKMIFFKKTLIFTI